MSVFSSRRVDALRCPACPSVRLVSRFVYHPVGRIGSCVSPRLATRWAGRRRLRCDCGVLSFLILISCRLSRLHVLACLGSSPPSDMDGGAGLRSVGSSCGLLAYPVVSVPFRLSSLYRSISWIVRLMRFGAVSRFCGYEFGGCHSLPCIIPSSLVVCDELIKTERAEMTFSLPPPFRFPAICVSPRPALLPVASCRGAGRNDLSVLSACLPDDAIMPMAMSDHP